MRIAYIDAVYKKKAVLPKKLIDSLPGRICLFTTVQFMSSFDSMKKQLEESGRKVFVYKTRHSFTPGHLLGCTVESFDDDFEAFLYVGDGLFHPQALLLNNHQDVIMYNPFDKRTRTIARKDMEKLERKKKGARVRFLSSRDIGVLVTTKAGQQQLHAALKLQDDFPDKRFYYLIANDINFQSLEDFPFIECFVNTACPRIAFDDVEKFTKPVLDLTEVRQLIDKEPYSKEHTAKA